MRAKVLLISSLICTALYGTEAVTDTVLLSDIEVSVSRVAMPVSKQQLQVSALEELYQEGKLKAIGISNFYADRMVEFCQFACSDFVNADGDLIQGVRPMVNQVEIHPYHQQNTLLEWMRKYDIQPEAWAPLGEGREGLFEDETLKAIAANHGKSLHQIVLRWHIQRGIAIFPMSRFFLLLSGKSKKMPIWKTCRRRSRCSPHRLAGRNG